MAHHCPRPAHLCIIHTMDDIGECYELDGPKRRGYVRFQTGNSRGDGPRPIWAAHRVAWMAVNGPIPVGGQILHHCDNRACIRSSHLYLGTNDDNVRDRVMRMRGYSKINRADALEIRRLYGRRGKNGMSGKALAERFGISRSQVSHIVNDSQWKDIEGLARG